MLTLSGEWYILFSRNCEPTPYSATREQHLRDACLYDCPQPGLVLSACSGLDLFQDGDWLIMRDVPLYVYDAGNRQWYDIHRR